MQPLTIHRYGNPQARPVVLVHALTEAGTAWPDLVDHWEDQWDIWAPDLRGHGHSPRFTADELRTAPHVMVADVVDVLEQVGEPVVLVGHSLGGHLALRAALARPELIAALILEDPSKPVGPGLVPQIVAANLAFLAEMDEPAPQVDRMLSETTWSRAEIDAWAQCKPLVDRQYIRHGLFLGDTLWEERFEALTVPTLVVVPPDSDMAPQGVRNELVRSVVIPHSGHCVRRDQPAAFHEAVDVFLATTAGAPS